MNSSRTLGISLAAVLLALGCVAGCLRGRTDEQIAAEVQGKIYADANVSSREITAQSNNGVVTLSGSVASETERAAAASDAAQVAGVKTVVNNLEVRAAAAPAAAEEPSVTHRRAGASGVPERAAATAASVRIPEGTVLAVRMIDSVDSEHNKAGDTFRASLDAPIVVGERTVVPSGADIEGRVVEQKSAGKFKGRSELALELTRLIVSGRSYRIETDEYTRQGSSRGKRTAETVGGGAALGAIIGAVAGGGKGAAIGAAAGAGAGTTVQAVTKGQQIKVPSETLLEFRLRAPVSVVPSSASRRARR